MRTFDGVELLCRVNWIITVPRGVRQRDTQSCIRTLSGLPERQQDGTMV